MILIHLLKHVVRMSAERHHHKTERVSECQASECPPVSWHKDNIGSCWLTSAKGNWLSFHWKGLIGVYLNITSLHPSLKHSRPLLQMRGLLAVPPFWVFAFALFPASSDSFFKHGSSFPLLPRVFVQMSFQQVFHHHPIYNCIPIYSTPSTQFLSKVLTPI